MAKSEPSLYGLNISNSNRSGNDLWGKNQFNATFPIALCIKMRDDGVSPVYVHVNDQGRIVALDQLISMSDVVESSGQGYYEFESSYPPYGKYSLGNESIDVVVSRRFGKNGNLIPTRPLEIKLTVVPDSSTSTEAPELWGPELVIRPISSAYAMLGIASAVMSEGNEHYLQEVKTVLRSCCQTIERDDWTNVTAIRKNSHLLTTALHEVVSIVRPLQSPFLVNTIWKTRGQSPVLAESCLDVFLWSDLSIVQIPLEQVSGLENARMTRSLREIARHVNALYSICTTGSFIYSDTYGGMSLSLQTDKSFSISGKVTRNFLAHERLRKPHYSNTMISEIILNRGEEMLRPERRLDASLVTQFTLNEAVQSMRLNRYLDQEDTN